jgi:hypothetical protein
MERLMFLFSPNKRYNMMDNWYVENLHIWSEDKILDVVEKYFQYKEVDKNKPPHNIRLILWHK